MHTKLFTFLSFLVFTSIIEIPATAQKSPLTIHRKKGPENSGIMSVQNPPCPQIQYTKSPSLSGNYDTLIIQNQTNNVISTNIDYCAGDLEQVPVMQSQQTGTPPIANASQLIPQKDGERYIGFIPAPLTSNATCFFKADFGNSLNNDISNFSTSLGTLQNRFPNPVFMALTKKDSVWFGFASSGDSKLWRIRFGASLDNNSPLVTEVILPPNTLASPAGAQIVKSGDTTYLFIQNANNLVTNNLVRLRFSDSLESTPNVSVLNNPLVLQNSNGFVQMSFGNACGKWIGLLLANSQLYRLDYGNSLSNTPTAISLTASITSGLGSPNAFSNLRGISLLQDMGRWYAFINTNTGNLIRVRFKTGLDQLPDQVVSLGSFGIGGTVGRFHFFQENSEFFGVVINNLGTIYKLKFPNNCPVSKSFRAMNGTGRDSTRFLESGKFYFTITAQSSNGRFSQVLDSVSVNLNGNGNSCQLVNLIHPEIICNEIAVQASVSSAQSFNSSRWDFCTGDFKLQPSRLAQAFATGVGSIGHQVVESNGNFYAFVSNNFGFYRLNLGTDPSGTPAQAVPITLPAGGTAFSSLTDFVIFKENDNWFALNAFATGESVVRLNFGADITNTTPGFAIINLPGYFSNPRGITLFEEFGNKYAAIASQNSGNITILNFGSTYRNIPIPNRIDVPGSVNLFKISMIRECQTWHAFVSDLVKDSVYHLRFRNGLRKAPSIRMLPVQYASGLRAVKDGNDFFLFVSKVQTGKNNLYRFSFGNSLENYPMIDSLGTFPGTAPNSGFTKINAFQLYQTDKSQYYFFGMGEAGQFYRLAFQNPCSAIKPIASSQNVNNQVYQSQGKFYFSFNAWDASGIPVSGFDSVTVQNLVDADFVIPGTRCKGEPVTFNDASITGPFTSITQWKWNFGDSLSGSSDSSSLPNPVHVFNQSGTYPVRLRVREQGGCINEIIRNVVIADKPRPNFQAGNGGTLCTNDSILFTDLSTSSNEPITERLWEIRKNNILIATSSRTNPRFFFAETGTYEVRLQVKGESQCDSLLIRNITVGSQGTLVSFSNPSACLDETVTFTPTLTGVNPDSTKWFVDAASFSTSGNFNYTFTSTAIYQVKLIAFAGQCANSFSKIVKVNARPLFSMALQAPLLCQGRPLNFSSSLDASQPVKYLWNFGDGTSDTLKNPVKSFADSGTFQVVLRVTSENGCFGEDTLSVRMKRAPIALFTFDRACKDEPVTFSNQSSANGIPGGITSYLWEFGTVDNQTSDQQNPGPVFYNEPPGIKIVRLTVRTAEDCPNTYTRNIAIGPKLAANFRKETGCIGTPFRFFDLTNSGNDSIVKWEWSIGGLNYNTRNPIVQFDLKGTYDVRLFVKSSSGCTDEVVRSQDVTVLDAATADFSISGTNFSEPPFQVIFRQLPDVNPSYNYSWDFGDSSSSISPNPPPHFYSKEGAYIVTMIATRSGTICSTTVQKAVNVISNPIQGVKIRKIFTARGNENIAVGIEAENQSNVALKSLDFILEAGKLLSFRETWNGILMPGAVLRYDFKSAIQYRSSQNIPYICAQARLSNPEKETSPEDNFLCSSQDSVSRLISVYPNPASESGTIDISLVSNDPIELVIFSSMGKEMYRLSEENPAPGRFSKTIETKNWPAGVYHILFRTGSVSEYKKLMIIRAD